MRDDPPPWQPWAALTLFAFLLNFPWEMLQVPFYRGLANAPHWTSTLFCLRASGGDVLIMLAAYGAVGSARGRMWLAAPTLVDVLAFVGVGLLITGLIEVVSIHALGRWTYADGVPTILGVGLPPLLQWIVLPPLVLWLTKRHVESCPARIDL